jgi:hypothetical protein
VYIRNSCSVYFDAIYGTLYKRLVLFFGGGGGESMKRCCLRLQRKVFIGDMLSYLCGLVDLLTTILMGIGVLKSLDGLH